MPVIKVDVRELDDEIQDQVFQFLEDVALELTNQLRIEAPVGATGDLQSSFQVLGRGDGVLFVGSRLQYAHYVQTGTRPHTPPFEPIKIWARRKLGDEDAAGPVWNKIREEGTDANPYIDRAIENTIERFQ